ncbi:MAG TPA: heterocyst frequency control protein PatD [Allocoleopsis sp.]
MLPEAHRQIYQEFLRSLEQLQGMATQAKPDPAALIARFQTVQQFFQGQILGLSWENDPDAHLEQRVQSYQIEMNKQLKLMGTDVMFLQAARQSSTAQQRQVQISDRLNLLIGYCNVLLQEKDEG